MSSAGFIDLDTGINHKWGIAGLVEYPVAEELRKVFSSAEVVWCLNDIEAHLQAGIANARGPVLAIAIGTSVGIAVTDEDGRIIRTRRDRPLECGQVLLRTSASNAEAWWALGNAGLEEQQARRGRREGTIAFGNRVGAFAAQYAAVFHARTVLLSGGVIAHNWTDMQATVEAEFAHGTPSWMSDVPTLIASPWGQDAALVGAARYAHHRRLGLTV